MILTEYLKGLVDVLIPRACLCCGKKLSNGKILCKSCECFRQNKAPYCVKCGLSLSKDAHKRICPHCAGKKFYFNCNLSPFLFMPPLSELIYLYKYRGYSFLASIFSEKIIEFIKILGLDMGSFDFISHVPLHARKLREREYNQSFLLAAQLSKYLALPVKDTLTVRRYSHAQVGKDYSKRQMNVKNNYLSEQRIDGKNIVLVDDVFTTGATLSECAKALKEAGAKSIMSLTLAIVNHENNS